MVQQVNGFKLDKSHTFAVNMFDDVSRYMQIPDEYEHPEDKEFETPVSPRRSSTDLHAALSCLSSTLRQSMRLVSTHTAKKIRDVHLQCRCGEAHILLGK